MRGKPNEYKLSHVHQTRGGNMKFQGFPEWFAFLKGDSLLTAKELAPMFGFKSVKSINEHVLKFKDFPIPDIGMNEMRKVQFSKQGINIVARHFQNDTKYWKKSTIVEFVEGGDRHEKI
jgi:hypothetical protein